MEYIKSIIIFAPVFPTMSSIFINVQKKKYKRTDENKGFESSPSFFCFSLS
jgi:hypothetical protein